jgi:hypothetical protein
LIREAALGDALAAIERQFGLQFGRRDEEERRVEERVGERWGVECADDPMPRPPVKPPQCGGDEEEYDAFVHSPAGAEHERKRRAWERRRRPYKRIRELRRELRPIVRRELRDERILRARSLHPLGECRPTPRRRERRGVRRGVRRASSRARSPGRLADPEDPPPDLYGLLLAFVRVRGWRP